MKKKFLCLFAAVACMGTLNSVANADHIWINEFHYDNAGADIDEFVEVGMRLPNGSGFNTADYAIELYNGNGGALYDSGNNNVARSLSTFTASAAFGIAGSTSTITLFTFNYTAAGSSIQNGAPDGIALVNVTNNTVEQFLSYEGSFTATGANGIAAALGATSVDVGVFEDGATTGTSLGAVGVGVGANQFGPTSYALNATASIGQVNVGQTFAAIPEPGSLIVLAGMGLVGTMVRRRK